MVRVIVGSKTNVGYVYPTLPGLELATSSVTIRHESIQTEKGKGARRYNIVSLAKY